MALTGLLIKLQSWDVTITYCQYFVYSTFVVCLDCQRLEDWDWKR
jgi:hypothetical protein